jgi:hypothetical protein
VGCGLPNGAGKPVFKPKERDSCALYKFVIVIVISSPAAPVAANIFIVVDVACILRWSIAASCVIHGVIAIRVVDTRRETVAQYAVIILALSWVINRSFRSDLEQ